MNELWEEGFDTEYEPYYNFDAEDFNDLKFDRKSKSQKRSLWDDLSQVDLDELPN